MRFVRIVLGLLLALVGLLATLAGAFTAFWLVGPDNTVDAGEKQLTSKGLAVATAPDLLDRNGPTLHVTAHSTDDKRPLFVGVAHDLDVSSYLKNVQYSKLVQVEFPIELTTQEIKGEAVPLVVPGNLDWWLAKASGTGSQSIAWPIADGPHDVVIMNADGKPAPDAQVVFGIEVDGLFLTCLLVLVVGLLLLAGGIFLMFYRRRPKPPATESAQNTQRVSEPTTNAPAPASQPGSVRRIARPLSVGLALVLTTSCAAVPEKDTAAGLTRPATSSEAAQAVIKRYNEVNNTANSQRNDKLIATVEAGSLARQSQAGYQIGRTLDKAGKDKAKPFTYTDPKIGAPEYGGYPMRFVSAAGLSTNKDYRQLGLWERASAASPWLLSYGVGFKTSVKVPDLTGLRQPTKADTAKLVSAPATVAADLAQYFTGGAKSPKAAVFAASPEADSLLKAIVDDRSHYADRTKFPSVTDIFTVTGQPEFFATAAGEALVFVTLTDQYALALGANLKANWNDEKTAFTGRAEYTRALTAVTLHQVALAVPVKGGGKVRILALESQLVDAGGY